MCRFSSRNVRAAVTNIFTCPVSLEIISQLTFAPRPLHKRPTAFCFFLFFNSACQRAASPFILSLLCSRPLGLLRSASPCCFCFSSLSSQIQCSLAFWPSLLVKRISLAWFVFCFLLSRLSCQLEISNSHEFLQIYVCWQVVSAPTPVLGGSFQIFFVN